MEQLLLTKIFVYCSLFIAGYYIGEWISWRSKFINNLRKDKLRFILNRKPFSCTPCLAFWTVFLGSCLAFHANNSDFLLNSGVSLVYYFVVKALDDYNNNPFQLK